MFGDKTKMWWNASDHEPLPFYDQVAGLHINLPVYFPKMSVKLLKGYGKNTAHQ